MRRCVTRVVLDASALLAWLKKERGHGVVERYLDDAVISTVNLSETIAKSLVKGGSLEVVYAQIQSLNLGVLSFTEEECLIAATFHVTTKDLGISLGDRACLALGCKLQLPVVTAEHRWKDFDSGVELIMIREWKN